jgi:hypothetical protein
VRLLWLALLLLWLLTVVEDPLEEASVGDMGLLRGGGGRLCSEGELLCPGLVGDCTEMEVLGTSRPRAAAASIDAALGTILRLLPLLVGFSKAIVEGAAAPGRAREGMDMNTLSWGDRMGRTGVGLVDLLRMDADKVGPGEMGEVGSRAAGSGLALARGLSSKASIIRVAAVNDWDAGARGPVGVANVGEEATIVVGDDDEASDSEAVMGVSCLVDRIGGRAVLGSEGSGNVLDRFLGKERGGTEGFMTGYALGGEVGRRTGARGRSCIGPEILRSGVVLLDLALVVASGVGDGDVRDLFLVVVVVAVGVAVAVDSVGDETRVGERGVAVDSGALDFDSVRVCLDKDEGLERVNGECDDGDVAAAPLEEEEGVAAAGRDRALLAAVG